jgi:hypothetical protein
MKYIAAASVLLIAAASCKKADWYDQKTSASQVVPASLKDFQALLDNSNMSFYSVGQGELASDNSYIVDISYASLPNWQKNAYTWSHELPNVQVDDWLGQYGNGPYQKLYYANLALEGVAKLTAGSFDYNNVKGQALFLRARNFYELSQIYAMPYNEATANTDQGIALRTESDINVVPTRSTVRQTYDQILKDFEEAKDLLPVTPAYKTRGSKPAVFGYLARLYLSIEDYPKAMANADSCLKYVSALYDWSVSDTAVTALSPIIPLFPEEVIFYGLLNGNQGGTGFAARLTQEMYDLYEVNDVRKRVCYTYSPADQTISFRGGFGNTGILTGITTSEMYLIKAECNARANKVTEAMADLNKEMKSRFYKNKFTDRTATDADDALRQVINERRRELVRRGLRWSDLRRLMKDPRFAKTFTRTAGGKTYTLAPGSFKYTLPFPDDIITQNGLPQTKGWE